MTINVDKATPEIDWPGPPDIAYGTSLSAAQLDATSLVPGTFTYTPAAGTVLNAGANQALSVLFIPSDSVDYNDATDTTMITVDQITPTITWSTPAPIVYGTALSGRSSTRRRLFPARSVTRPRPARCWERVSGKACRSASRRRTRSIIPARPTRS